MRFSLLLREAYISLAASKLRSFLAMLGIVIGVGSVVLMMAIGSGSRKAIEDSIAKLGSNILIITPAPKQNKGVFTFEASYLEEEDARMIASLPEISALSLATRSKTMQVSLGKNNWNTQISGVQPAFFDIRSWALQEGDHFSEDEMRLGKRVAIIGATIAQKLGGDNSHIVGQPMKIGDMSFRIIGILSAKGRSFDGRDQDDVVYVPFNTAQIKLIGNTRYGTVDIIYVQVQKKDQIDYATQAITERLRERKKLRPSEENNFIIRDLTAIGQVFTETTKAFSILLGAIASISLLVGGIGIMNIMLVTVTERTREIGVRKAVGADNRLILLQFLIESIILVGIGSATGLLAGIAVGMGIEYGLGTPVDISLWSVALAVGVTIVIGTLSGLYPARRAANLHPIEALRSVGA